MSFRHLSFVVVVIVKQNSQVQWTRSQQNSPLQQQWVQNDYWNRYQWGVKHLHVTFQDGSEGEATWTILPSWKNIYGVFDKENMLRSKARVKWVLLNFTHLYIIINMYSTVPVKKKISLTIFNNSVNCSFACSFLLITFDPLWAFWCCWKHRIVQLALRFRFMY